MEPGPTPAAPVEELDAPAAPAAVGQVNKEALSSAVTRAQDAYEAAIAAQRSGDWASFGQHLSTVGEALQDIENEIA